MTGEKNLIETGDGMATAKDVMSVAISYIGTKEYPANSNKVIFNTEYYGSAVSGSAYPWCCVFVWYCFKKANASQLFYNGKKTAYCPTVAIWAKANNLTVSKSQGRYGDIVLFDWNGDGVADHIGFIESKNSDGSYTTIEGNTSYGNDSNGGEVMRRTRYQSQICMIIRPKYSEDDEMTDADWKRVGELIDEKLEAALKGYDTEPSNWAKEIIKEAVEKGITDGSRPLGYAKREEVAAMVLKGTKISEVDGK